jgi:NAD(P)-dependent dehydrogenase (short-subunit alcohol dehydrogenase family)
MIHKFRSVLAVGATGMLREALNLLAAHSERTVVVARNASQALADRRGAGGHLTALDVDWRDTDNFEAALEPVLDAGVDLALLWLHGSGAAALDFLLERLARHECLIVHVIGSRGGRPDELRETFRRDFGPVPGCRYRAVKLGAVTDGTGRRWLSHSEISAGALEAVRSETDVFVGDEP